MAWIGQERVELYFYSHIRLHGSVKAQEQLYLYLVQKPVMLTEVSRGFHQSFHENTGIVFMSLPVIFLKTIIKISMFRDTMPPNSQHNVMEHSPFWEANTHSASQETPCLLWNPKVHYHDNCSIPLAPILSQIHLINTFPACFLRIHSTIILSSLPMSSECSVPFRFSESKILHTLLSLQCVLHALPISSFLSWSPQ